MTKTIKNTIIACLVAVFAFLPFIFAGCNEKEIEDYKAQINNLQEQNTALQEQVNTIHTPTEQERKCCKIIIEAAKLINNNASSPEEVSMAFRLETSFLQFSGIEFNKVLNIGYTGTQQTQKEQIVFGSNNIKINIEGSTNAANTTKGDAGYAFITVNYNAETNKATSVILEQYIKNGDDTYYVEVQEYTFGTPDTFTQNQYTQGALFEAVQQKAQNFATVKTDVNTTMIQAGFA